MMFKPLLIFVHGMFCHSGVWDQMIAYFKARGYDCLAIDLPYHDQAPHLPPHPNLGKTSIKDYVRFMKGVINGIDREYILIGHSMGGLIVMITASLVEINPKSIVLLAPAAPWGITALKPSVLKAFMDIMMIKKFWTKAVKMEFERLEQAMLNRLPESDRFAIYQRLCHESGRVAFEMGFWIFDSTKATYVNPKGITCPVSIFVGTEDQITPHEVVAKIAKKLGYKKLKVKEGVELQPARIELVLLDGHGHWLLTEIDYALIEAALKK